ncbi:Fibrinogen C-terminal domain-containing protein [Caenorhabditis elegans]|uniref:Fibrinogen C-terminal domain-containing protein n=1 Tax=Caenorhabditis elegans TaxID=6239 RepID=H2KYR5_CAEEL|nr:Fibrinogen C-terminal domain-containing protein [Caenorhabditis elegans]CCD64416.1 Fibrinogen C-terminal domain-containing protein [Caenorhabditis elegans]|eukprot:NP_001024509.1 Uncharacterized protein CELE_D1009.3 [Caenorhabditis elegans]
MMQDTKDEHLTSFAENPTKSVERDALVEPQFTRPEQVEKTHVEEAKWPWGKGKKNEKMPRFLVTILLICLLVAALLIALIAIVWALNSNSASVREPEIVYTIPSRDNQKDNVVHARSNIPKTLKKSLDLLEEDTTTITTTTSQTPDDYDTTEPFVEEEEYHLEEATEHHEIATIEATTPEPSEIATKKPIIYYSPPTTPKTTTSTGYLQFYDSIDGDASDNCLERLALGSPSGVYSIQSVEKFQAFCDMDTTTGGWTVIQRRVDGDGSFHRGTMKKFVEGFGNLQGSHWLGLEKLHNLAPIGATPAILRIEIQGETCDLTCSKRFANTWVGEWKVNFGKKQDGYKIQITEEGVGNLTYNGVDPFFGANGRRFSTNDNDQDENTFMNCAQFRMVGPWWHPKSCSDVGLNGYFQTTSEKYDVKDRNQNAKRYFVWAFDKQIYNGYPYTIHVRKSTMLLKTGDPQR